MWRRLTQAFGRSAGREVLPARILDEIHRRDAAAERMIGWVQFGVVAFFAVLYAIAPRAEGSQGFNFVPWALAAYFLFTVVRLVLSYRRELPDWYLVLSIVADVGLLVGIIFSFHVQYGQHPTFYLKAPTLMYVFLFIALRALRLDPSFVLTTGAVAALGWAGLVGYAIFADMGGMHITRNYVDYLTSNSILIGAELDKLIIIVAVTGILSVGLYRARAIFFEAIRDHVAAEDLKRFFAPEVARSITGADVALEAGQGISREAAVMLVDIRSFTTAAERLPAEAVMRILGRYQECVLPIIQRNNGRIDKFLGDGILATFGAVHPSDAYAADALAAAVEIVTRIRHRAEDFVDEGWPEPLHIGVAVACGPVTIGVVGAASRLEYTVIGAPVNLAAKLEDANKRLGTAALTTAACVELARAQGGGPEPVEIRKGLTIAGVGQPLDVAVLASS